jgi:hypothetical protein
MTRHFDTILSFLQPGDVGHKIDLTVDDIEKMHTVPDSDHSLQLLSRGPLSDSGPYSGQNVPLPDQGEKEIIQTSESSDRTVRIVDMVDNSLCEDDLTLKHPKSFKQTTDVSPES